MKLNPNDMLIFVKVAEQRSFTSAARVLGKTTSAISQTVSRLEKDLDKRLLHRTTRSISLTEEGQRALSLFRDMQDAYQIASHELLQKGPNPTGTLSVTAPHALSESVIVPALADYSKSFPKVTIRLISEDAPLDMIERRIDLSIRVGRPSGQNARISKIGMLKEFLYAHRRYVRSKGGRPTKIEQLAEWHHVANEWQGSPIKITSQNGSNLSVRPDFQCTCSSDVLRFVWAGAGVGVLPATVVQQSKMDNDLIPLFAVNSTPIYTVHHYETGAPTKVKEFIKILREKFSATG